jgi:hypothetical protein
MRILQNKSRQICLLLTRTNSRLLVSLLLFFSASFTIATGAFAQQADCNFDKRFETFFRNPVSPKDSLIVPGGKLFALLVGVNDVRHGRFAPLRRPEPDIDTLSAILKNQHYNVVVLKGKKATKQNIFQWLHCFRRKLKIKDRLLFYFAGHAQGLSEMAPFLAEETHVQYHSKISEIFDFAGTPRFKDSLCLLLRQPSLKISNFLEVEEIATLLDEAKAYQKVMIIDACYGGIIDRIFHLPLDVFSHRLRSDGFFALTSAKRPVEDSLTAPIFFEALRGAADDTLAGNRDGAVSIYEVSIYMDHKLHEARSNATGEPYKSRYIFVGSGEVKITAYAKKSVQNE